MILSDAAILDAIDKKEIVISPFKRACLGPNSYDVHLSEHIAIYTSEILDAKSHNRVRRELIPDDGKVLLPGIIYLASTSEYTESHKHVPFLDGKSSVGRLGIDIHATAGKGDLGFCNHWTLEISVCQPVRVYKHMPIGQLIFFNVSGTALQSYSKRKTSKYAKRSRLPMESMMWKNHF